MYHALICHFTHINFQLSSKEQRVLILLCTLVLSGSLALTQVPFIYQVYFDVGKPAGRIIMGLFGNIVPKTTGMFSSSFTWDRGFPLQGKSLHYKGSIFHRIIPHFMIQGGDFTLGDGMIWNICHKQRLFVSFRFVWGSQLFITTVTTSRLDGKHVVFGKALSGMDVVYKFEAQGRLSCTPKNKIVIVGSGEISAGRATT
ncbi:hypothetical protein V6Z11_D07G114300 [Gossypium hirsutum]